MTTAGMHDNDGAHLTPRLPELVPEPRKVMAYGDVHIHLSTATRAFRL